MRTCRCGFQTIYESSALLCYRCMRDPAELEALIKRLGSMHPSVPGLRQTLESIRARAVDWSKINAWKKQMHAANMSGDFEQSARLKRQIAYEEDKLHDDSD